MKNQSAKPLNKSITDATTISTYNLGKQVIEVDGGELVIARMYDSGDLEICFQFKKNGMLHSTTLCIVPFYGRAWYWSRDLEKRACDLLEFFSKQHQKK